MARPPHPWKIISTTPPRETFRWPLCKISSTLSVDPGPTLTNISGSAYILAVVAQLVECFTGDRARDQGIAVSNLTRGTALCP